jgi:hypothetical protein
MQNDIEKNKLKFDKEEAIKTETFSLKVQFVVMIILLLTFLSFFYILNEMFANHKTFFNSVSSLINFVKINWWKYFFGYGSFIVIYVLGAFAHLKIIKKKGGFYNAISLLAVISMIYLGLAIFFQSIDGLKLMYTENFKLWCFTIVCIAICVYYFLIEKDIIR